MIFISLGKKRKKPGKELAEQATEVMDEIKSRGIKIIGWYIGFLVAIVWVIFLQVM